MLGFLFGFNARLGRLHFLLATIALAIVMTAICFLIAYALRSTSGRMLQAEDLLGNWPAIGAMILFAWATFTLQSMRIRDIGWDPVCVVPLGIAFMIIDRLVATKIPAWSVGQEEQGTAVGALINLVLILVLLLWPSAEHDGSGATSDRKPGWSGNAAGSSTVATDRLARAAQGAAARLTWS